MVRANDTLSLTPAQMQVMRRTSDTKTAGDIKDSKEEKLSILLRFLYLHGPLSRPELAKLAKLSVPTISSLIGELIAQGTVRNLGVIAEAKVGKPAAKVEINVEGNVCIALDLTEENAFTGAVVDLEGNILSQAHLETGDVRGDEALDLVLQLADRLISQTSAKVIGIGAAAPGLVDDMGSVLVAIRWNWRNVPLAQRITEHTGLPTVVGNDVNLMALGLRRIKDRSDQDAIIVTIDNGVGAAIVMNGQPVIGQQFAAGEIGHLLVDPNGPQCVCGRRGCLDVVASATYLSKRVSIDGSQVLAHAGSLLGSAVAPVMSMLNINELVLLGPSTILTDQYVDAVRSELHTRILPVIASNLVVETVPDEHDLTILGATSAVLERCLGVL